MSAARENMLPQICVAQTIKLFVRFQFVSTINIYIIYK